MKKLVNWLKFVKNWKQAADIDAAYKRCCSLQVAGAVHRWVMPPAHTAAACSSAICSRPTFIAGCLVA